MSGCRQGGAGVALALLVAAAAARGEPTPPTIAGLPPQQTRGRGAELGFAEYEAENGRTNGRVIGPDRAFGTLESEASGRRAVRLKRPGDYVEVILAEPADAMTVRYAIPDSADGRGLDASLGVYVAGERLASVPMTSRYGWFYGSYPFTNNPADGKAHHFYDEARLKLPRRLPAGTRVRLMVGPQDLSPWYVIDLLDFERVPPALKPPAGAHSVADFGADPTGHDDASDAIQRALDAGRGDGRPVWLPPGTYRVTRHLKVDAVELAGAGPWWSILAGKGVGVYGRMDGGTSRAVTLRDFAIVGEVMDRDDHANLAGIGGSLGGGSVVRNVWISHTKNGLWLDGPADGLEVSGVRVTDLTADGLNLKGGYSRVVVENSFFRNVGDDGLALWSKGLADHDIVFRRNTVIAPVLANGIGVYGGRDIAVEDNLVADTVTEGGGLHVGNRFSSVPVSGTIRFSHDLVVRGGGVDPHWKYGVGAMWLYALDAPIAAEVQVRDVELVDSTFAAVQVFGRRIDGAPLRVDGLSLSDVRIRGAGGYALLFQAPGAGDFAGVTVEDAALPGVLDCGSGYAARRLGGDRGWDGTACPPKRPPTAGPAS
jgi:hypothetical protein